MHDRKIPCMDISFRTIKSNWDMADKIIDGAMHSGGPPDTAILRRRYEDLSHTTAVRQHGMSLLEIFAWCQGFPYPSNC